MDWADTPEQAAFREEVRTFIQTRLPEAYKGLQEGEGVGWQADRKSSDESRRTRAMTWANALAEKGWIAPHWPKEYGGAGLSHHGAVHLQPGDGLGAGAQRRRHGRLAHRADADRARQRRAEGRAPAQDPLRRDRLGAGLLGAGRRLGPRLAPDARRPRRRRLRDQRAEDLDLRRAVRRLAVRPRADRPRGAEAPRHLVPHDGHQDAGPHRPAADRHGVGASPSTRRSSRTCASRPRTSSARRTAAGTSA